MILYSYIFNTVYKGYTKSGDEHPGIYAVGIVTIMQTLAVAFLILLPIRLKGEKLGTASWIIGLVTLVVMLINYIYFYKVNTPAKISEKMESLNPKKIKVLRALTWIYAIILIGMFIFLANLPKSN